MNPNRLKSAVLLNVITDPSISDKRIKEIASGRLNECRDDAGIAPLSSSPPEATATSKFLAETRLLLDKPVFDSSLALSYLDSLRIRGLECAESHFLRALCYVRILIHMRKGESGRFTSDNLPSDLVKAIESELASAIRLDSSNPIYLEYVSKIDDILLPNNRVNSRP